MAHHLHGDLWTAHTQCGNTTEPRQGRTASQMLTYTARSAWIHHKNIILIIETGKNKEHTESYKQHNIIMKSIRNIRNASTIDDTLAFPSIANTVQNTC